MRQSAASIIDVIIVNYGTAQLAIAAVESALSQDLTNIEATVHVLDNASPGNDEQILQDAHHVNGWGKQVNIWPEKTNHGFGRGNNVVLDALARTKHPPDYVLLLNPDAALRPNALQGLVTALQDTPRAAAAGGCIYVPQTGPTASAFRFPGLISEIAQTIDFGPFDRLINRWRVPLPVETTKGFVDWLSGASVMFRFEALKNCGFFDPAFFLYYEEVELMHRLRKAGWLCLYVPEVKIDHQAGAATGAFQESAVRKRRASYLYTSWRIYFTRTRGWGFALLVAVLMYPCALINILHRRLRLKAPTLPLHFFRDHWTYVMRPLLRQDNI